MSLDPHIGNRVHNPPQEILSILDHIAPPDTFDELVMQIQAKDCRMFHPMTGLPRAYMEVPGSEGVERWVYKVFGWWMHGTRSQCEAPLAAAAWKTFVDFRKQFATFYGDMEPLLVWRREPEFEECSRQTGPCFEHGLKNCGKCERGPLCKIYMRFAIPGLELGRHPQAWDERSDRTDRKYQVIPEPRT